MKIREEIIKAMDPAKAVVLAEALSQLAMMRLEAAARWRVQQLEHALCEKAPEQLEEP